jgi:hypothetical protein
MSPRLPHTKSALTCTETVSKSVARDTSSKSPWLDPRVYPYRVFGLEAVRTPPAGSLLFLPTPRAQLRIRRGLTTPPFISFRMALVLTLCELI